MDSEYEKKLRYIETQKSNNKLVNFNFDDYENIDDLLIKIKKEFLTKSSVVYGYDYDLNSRAGLSINKKCAKTIKLIYKLWLDGMSLRQIAKYLNDNKIKSPREEKLKIINSDKKKEKTCWTNDNVRRILKDSSYVGDVILNRFDRGKTFIHKNEWIIVHNVAQPIVSKEIYDKAQSLFKVTSPRSKNYGIKRNDNYLKKLSCYHCKKMMTPVTKDTQGNVRKFKCYAFICKEPHEITIDKLNDLVQKTLKTKFYNTEFFLNKLNEEYGENFEKYQKKYKDIAIQLDIKIDQKKQELKDLYMEKLKNIVDESENKISNKEFRNFLNNYNKESLLILNQIATINRTKEKYKNYFYKSIQTEKKFNKYKNFRNLSKGLFDNFIKMVYLVNESKVKIEYTDDFDEYYKFLSKSSKLLDKDSSELENDEMKEIS